MKWTLLFYTLAFTVLSACGRSAPVAPAKLPVPPAVVATQADAVLVWIRPDQWPQPGGSEPGGTEPGGTEPGGSEPGGSEPGGSEPGEDSRTGLRNEPLPGRTFWIAQTGSAWTIAGTRSGLLATVGPNLYELQAARFNLRLTELPPPAEGESDGLTQCRQVFDGTGEVALSARGTGLVMRDLMQRTDVDLFPAPGSIADLDYNAYTLRITDVLGGLGKYLFVRILGHEAPCGTSGDELARFEVVDLEASRVVTREVFDPTDGGPWIRYFDLPQRRRELAPGLKRQLKAYDASAEYEPDNLQFSSTMPIFPNNLATVAFQTTYRYWGGCRACPQFDSHALVEALPPELADDAQRHPALALVDVRLPEGWCIGGITRLSAPPARVAALRARFEAAGERVSSRGGVE